MTHTARMLDKARELCIPPTWYRLAKELDIAQQSISRALHHGGGLDNEAAFRLAKLLRLPEKDVIAYIEQDRAKDDETREFWRRQSPRALPTVVLATMIAGSMVGGMEAGFAKADQPSTRDNLYIMRTGWHPGMNCSQT